MAKRIRFSYDKEGDVLDISLGEPRKAIAREINDDFFIRVDVKSKEIVGFSVLNFEKGFHKFLAEKYPDVVNDIEKQKELTDSIAQRLDRAGNEFKTEFLKK